jgi:hypothetical protein
MKKRFRTKRKPTKRYKKYKSIKRRIIGGKPGTEEMVVERPKIMEKHAKGAEQHAEIVFKGQEELREGGEELSVTEETVVERPEDLLYSWGRQQKMSKYNRVNPFECGLGHYAKMGIDKQNAAILQGHNKAKTRPPNHVLEKLHDRNDPKGSGDGVCFEDFNNVLINDPVVYLVGHGSIKRGPSVHLPDYGAFMVNFNQSGMVGISGLEHTRKTDDGILVNLPHDMRGFLKNIVGNKDMTPDVMAKYHFFKPGRELVYGDKRVHEVRRNFHYVPSCANNEHQFHWDLGWVKSMHLLTSDGGVYRGHVGKNVFAWSNPKVYGGERSVFKDIAMGGFAWNYAEKKHNIFNQKTESGIYIFNEDEGSPLTDEALNNLCGNLKLVSGIYKVDGSNRDYSVNADIVWERDDAGPLDGLNYIHIFTKPNGTINPGDPRMKLWTGLAHDGLLDCFKKLFNRPFTLIDTVCRCSLSNDIGDNTADMARQISTRTRVPGGIPDDHPSRQGQQDEKNTFLYVTIKVPPEKHLHVGDRLAIFKSDITFTADLLEAMKEHVSYISAIFSATAFSSAAVNYNAILDTGIYPFTITAAHINQVRPDVSGGLQAGEKIDVQIDTSKTSTQPLSEWIIDLTPGLDMSDWKLRLEWFKNHAKELGIEQDKIEQATSYGVASNCFELKKLIYDKYSEPGRSAVRAAAEREAAEKEAIMEKKRNEAKSYGVDPSDILAASNVYDLDKLINAKIMEPGKMAMDSINQGGYRKKLSRKKRKRIKKTKRFKHKKNKSKRKKLRNHK